MAITLTWIATAQTQAAAPQPPWLLLVALAVLVVSAVIAGVMTRRASRSADTARRTDSADVISTAGGSLPEPKPATAPEAASDARTDYHLLGVGGPLSGADIPIRDECILSRGPLQWLVIPDAMVSAPHLAIDLTQQPTARIKDLSSKNGVRLGDAALSAGFVELGSDQAITIGRLQLAVDLQQRALRVTRGAMQGQTFALPAAYVVLSRREMPVVVTGDADTRLSDAHALLYVDGRQLMIKDLNSSNGASVNRQRITHPMALQVNDEIELGRSTFRVVAGGAAGSQAA